MRSPFYRGWKEGPYLPKTPPSDDDDWDAESSGRPADFCEDGEDADDSAGTPGRQSPPCRSYFELPEQRTIDEIYFSVKHIFAKSILTNKFRFCEINFAESTYWWNMYFVHWFHPELCVCSVFLRQIYPKLITKQSVFYLNVFFLQIVHSFSPLERTSIDSPPGNLVAHSIHWHIAGVGGTQCEKSSEPSRW